jgi:hypothetical protein
MKILNKRRRDEAEITEKKTHTHTHTAQHTKQQQPPFLLTAFCFGKSRL